MSVAGHPAGGGDVPAGVGDGVLPPGAAVLLARVAGVVAAGTMTELVVVGAEVIGGAGGACTVDKDGAGGACTVDEGGGSGGCIVDGAGGYNTTQDTEVTYFSYIRSYIHYI